MSAFSEGYRELLEEARGAIRDLLDESKHDAFIQLRYGYREIRRVIESDNQKREEEARRSERESKIDAAREGERAWKGASPARREHVLLNALGDGHLIIRELVPRMNAELGYPPAEGQRGKAIYDSDVRRLLEKMLRAGQLERVKEAFGGGNKFRWRYSVKRTLDGPIVDLERAYQDEQEGGD